MAGRHFRELLEKKWDEKKFLCVGLDTDFEKIPGRVREKGAYEGILEFNKAIVDATKDIVCAFKPNAAFYEAHGDVGFAVLRATTKYINEAAPDVPVILDAKRADIGNTNNGYIESAFENLGADAITVHPYLGSEALAPFLERADKGVIVLCRTSNPGAGEFQDLLIEGEPLYMRVAREVNEKWNRNRNCALVVGATYPEEMRSIREISDDLPFLIPGIGAQGGDLEKTVAAGKDSQGRGMVISASRSVLYASSGEDFAQVARQHAQELHDSILKSL